MANKLVGTEKPLVELCQAEYQNGWVDKSQRLAACTLNAAKFLTSYSIFGLQEVHGSYRLALQSAIQSTKADADYGFLVAEYFKQWFIVLGYDKKVTGPATELYRGLLIATDNKGTINPDQRAIQVVYFAKLNLVVVNLHAAHRIDLKRVIEQTLSSVKLPAGVDPQRLRIAMLGDFNDEAGILLKSSAVEIFSQRLTIPGGKRVLACCTDSNYRLPGDYIMLSDNLLEMIKGEYGFPLGYQRHQPLMSDHDPVAVKILLRGLRP